MPEGHVCCGRPLYDYGMLDMAERYLHRTIDALRPHLRAGLPVVGIEPSCLATFKEELGKLLPHDDDAVRLRRQAHHFAEFFDAYHIDPPRLRGTALVWGHCHHKASGGIETEHELLRRMGLDVEAVTGGCCGLAGSWGFEAAHYELSMRIGEEALLPAVRAAEPGTLIVADGFSCKTQIEDAGAGRRALHVAQVMELAHRTNGSLPAGRAPDTLTGGRPRPDRSWRAPAAAAAGAAAAAVVVAAARRAR
jgi:Fe-S oxidoreductase